MVGGAVGAVARCHAGPATVAADGGEGGMRERDGDARPEGNWRWTRDFDPSI